MFITADWKNQFLHNIMYVSRQNIDMPHIMGIACSGHRVAEAMDLKETDIHWEHGDINIKCYSCHDAVGD